MEIEVEGATLNVEADGNREAPPVLLWHGARCTLRQWDRVVELLGDSYFLVRFDVRGSGKSSPSADPSQYTLETYAADANAILDHFGIGQCHIWSMAWGSRAALAYCSLHPERIMSAALFDASVGRADVDAQRAGAREAQAQRDAAGIPRFAPPEGWNAHDVPDEVLALSLAAAGKFDLPGAVVRLTMPVLVATGELDPNLESSRDIVARAPDAQLVVLEKTGHGSILQRPDLATQTFTGFQADLFARSED